MNESNGPRTGRRTARACDSCYKRKIKCDAASPQCNWCSHHNLSCTFDRVVQRKRKLDDGESGGSKNSHLSERISRIEQLLAENMALVAKSDNDYSSILDSGKSTESSSNSPSTSTPASTSSQPLQVSSSVGVHFAGRELGVISLLTGIPFLLPEGQEWIQARTGQTISSDKLSPAQAPWEQERGASTNAILLNIQNTQTFELPDKRCVTLFYEAFKDSPVMRRIFPILDDELFPETIRNAYQQPQNTFSFGQASTRACIMAFVAFVARLCCPVPPVKEAFPDISEIGFEIDHEAWAAKAQILMSQVLQEPANLDGAQAVLMLTLYQVSSGNMRATNYIISVAARFILMLGGNLANGRIYPESEKNQRKQHHIRNLFWVCYTMDKDIALRTGQPPTISDENCDLTLPPGYADHAFLDPIDTGSSAQPSFPFDLRLSIIKSRAHSALYSVSAIAKSDADLLKSIRELDDELEEWRISIPQQWRPTMSFTPEASDPNVSMHSVMLRLNYYLCISLIHSASSRCKAWREGTGMLDGINSSLALSVEASRSTLCYLEAADHVLVEGVFWTLLFYPMSALLSIFCSILSNPLDPRSRDDLDRLNFANTMMRRVFFRKSGTDEAVQLKVVADFVTELKHLAECAIDKAWREQSAKSAVR